MVSKSVYNGDHDDPVSYDKHFALILSDYNYDGNPDYLFKSATSTENGSEYRIQLMDETGKLNTPYLNHSGSMFVYGKFDGSIKLMHIDDDIFACLTYRSDEIEPLVLKWTGTSFNSCPNELYEHDDCLFLSEYRNGKISYSAINSNGTSDEVTAEVSLQRLDDKVWRDYDKFDAQTVTFMFDKFGYGCVKSADCRLPQGRYRMLFKTSVDGRGEALFTVN